jgi:uncharacterized protein (TIGR01244 family)
MRSTAWLKTMSCCAALLTGAVGALACLAADPASLSALPQVRFPEEHRIVSGAISAEDVERARKAGVRHVVNLRPTHENAQFDEAREVERRGMTYHYLPISDAQSLTKENVVAFNELLGETGDSPTLIHCSSGNRVGAVIALREAWLKERPPEEAIAEGKRWGLTKLEGTVRGLLEEDARSQKGATTTPH